MTEFKADDFQTALQTGRDLGAHYDLKYEMSRALENAIDGVCNDKKCLMADKKTLISKSLDQHASCMKDWWGKYLDITQPETEEDDEMSEEAMSSALERFSKGSSLTEKEGRVISNATKKKLAQATSHLSEVKNFSKSINEAIEKGLGIVGDLSTGRYFNDVNRPNPVGGPPATGSEGTENPVGGGKESSELLSSLSKTLQLLKK